MPRSRVCFKVYWDSGWKSRKLPDPFPEMFKRRAKARAFALAELGPSRLEDEDCNTCYSWEIVEQPCGGPPTLPPLFGSRSRSCQRRR